MAQANITAIGTSVGFGGKTDPLKRLREDLRLREVATAGEVLGMMAEAAEAGARLGPDPNRVTRVRNRSRRGIVKHRDRERG